MYYKGHATEKQYINNVLEWQQNNFHAVVSRLLIYRDKALKIAANRRSPIDREGWWRGKDETGHMI